MTAASLRRLQTASVAPKRARYHKRRPIGAPPRWLSTPAKLVLGALYLIPLLWIVLTSFKSNAQILQSPNAILFQPTLSTFRQVWQTGGAGVLLSLRIAGLATVLVLAVGVPGSYALARRISKAWARFTALLLGVLLILQMVPEPMTVIPLFGVLDQWHLLNLWGLTLCDATLLVPFAILLLRPFVLAIPGALYEAAAVDGASRWQGFLRVVVPMLGNGIITVGAIVFISAWGEFIYAINFLPLGGAFPVSALLADQISNYAVNWNQMMALAFLTSVPLVILFLFVQKRLVRGLSVGAFK